MTLTPSETARFYRIWWPLLAFVNERRQLVPDWPASPREGSVKPSDAHTIREALWADDALREAFIEENPAHLGPDDLALAGSWRHRVAGRFTLLRHLKKHSVFLSESPTRAYGVLGLVSPLDEVIPLPPPVFVQTVLLPFEDKIIYDSLIAPYPVLLGPGIRASLNDAYRDAQEREGVLTSLLPVARDEARKGIRARNARLLAAFRTEMAGSGLSVKMIEQHAGNIEAFGEMQLLAEDPPRGLRGLRKEDVSAYRNATARSAGAGKTALTSLKRFVRFLRDTGRMDPESAWDLLDSLND